MNIQGHIVRFGAPLAAIIALSGTAVAANLSPPPVLSPPSAFAYGAAGYSTPFISDICSLTGSNCVIVDSLDSGEDVYAAEALFTPNLIFPNFIAPSVTAFASSNNGLFSEAESILAYNFEVFLPTQLNAIIPLVIDLTASGSVSSSGSTGNDTNAGVAAELSITNPDGTSVAQECIEISISTVGCSGGTSFSLRNSPVNIYANEIYTVDLVADAIDLYEDISMNANIDPSISIDPTSLALYPTAQLDLSPGVVQQPISSSVPEPSSFFLLAAGLIGLRLHLVLFGRAPVAAKAA
jgi:PEP-CTERM motif